jgi:glycosyltransferase involved in cell wall biosynthesis
VHIVGEIRGGRKTWLYERCGLFVLPSQNENFGMTVAEAMAAGCFVLTTEDTAAYKHAMNAGACAVIPELRVTAVASSMSSVLRSGRLTAEASRSARDYAAEHLSWEATARNIRNRLLMLRQDVQA